MKERKKNERMRLCLAFVAAASAAADTNAALKSPPHAQFLRYTVNIVRVSI